MVESSNQTLQIAKPSAYGKKQPEIPPSNIRIPQMLK